MSISRHPTDIMAFGSMTPQMDIPHFSVFPNVTKTWGNYSPLVCAIHTVHEHIAGLFRYIQDTLTRVSKEENTTAQAGKLICYPGFLWA